MNVLMLDNYDSFTYNLVQYLGELGASVTTVRNDQISADEVPSYSPDAIVLSPGPCTPNEAGICLEVLESYAQQYPILGVCLGHQCIGQVFGANIVHARSVMHGKTSAIQHDNQGVFRDIPTPYQCTRYHSLVIEESSIPECLEISSRVVEANGTQGEIMGVRHRELPIEGVQFHPESILTEHGHALLDNFLHLARQSR
ncbi:MAG: anthranilate synthase component II [Gammaproteobacteria bacterium]